MLSFFSVDSALGTLHLIWHRTRPGPRVVYIVLPGEQVPTGGFRQTNSSAAAAGTCPEILELGEQLQACLAGDLVEFDLQFLALDRCGEFQRKVLLTDCGIPRGTVSTYGLVARALGNPAAARAVGQALARNSFPVVIPCHRVVRSDGRLGGYRGGLGMKRSLLQLEGVGVTTSGKVAVGSFFFPADPAQRT
jgi:methylated-DNA-[protein]-cysteine S-methyltransferase